jgi:hypothetical protein
VKPRSGEAIGAARGLWLAEAHFGIGGPNGLLRWVGAGNKAVSPAGPWSGEKAQNPWQRFAPVLAFIDVPAKPIDWQTTHSKENNYVVQLNRGQD